MRSERVLHHRFMVIVEQTITASIALASALACVDACTASTYRGISSEKANICLRYSLTTDTDERWRGGATGRALDLRSTGRGFKSYSGQKLHITTLGKLFTPMCLRHQAV